MTRAEEYRYLAESVRGRAKVADSKGQAMEWIRLADCYDMLAKQSERSEQVNQARSEDKQTKGTLN